MKIKRHIICNIAPIWPETCSGIYMAIHVSRIGSATVFIIWVKYIDPKNIYGSRKLDLLCDEF